MLNWYAIKQYAVHVISWTDQDSFAEQCAAQRRNKYLLDNIIQNNVFNQILVCDIEMKPKILNGIPYISAGKAKPLPYLN